MNWLDVVLLLILVCSVVTSFRKGVTREVIGLVSVVLGLLLGSWFYGLAGAFLLPYVSSNKAANFAGFFLVFCLVLLLGSLLSFVLGKFLKVTGLSIFDHALGAGFGLVRGMLIAVALILGVMAFSQSGKPPDAVVNSRMAPYLVQGARVFADMAPHELKEGFHKTYVEAKSAWENTLNKGIRKLPKTEPEAHEKRI
jgi:membrane protein required for colicin V production